MAVIKSIKGQRILDSAGLPTIEVTAMLEDGSIGIDSVPTGLHTGRYEAAVIQDIGKVVSNIESIIAPSLVGQESTNQEQIDRMLIGLDGSSDKSNLGGNTLLGVSLAIARASAVSAQKSLFQYLSELSQSEKPAIPTPIFNVIDGGKHTDNLLSFQEFLVIPEIEASFEDRLSAGYKVFLAAKKILERMGQRVSAGEEGGFAPKLQSNEEALEVLVDAILEAGYRPKDQISIGIDVAASAIPDLNVVTYPYNPVEYYMRLVRTYPISFLEDPFNEDAWDLWGQITSKLGAIVSIIGDDLFSTNIDRLKQGIELKLANGISVKPNQIGTLTETFEAIKLAKSYQIQVMISHRARETEDTFIADLAVGTKAKYIKAGAQSRGERIAKYNQLLRIERILTQTPPYLH